MPFHASQRVSFDCFCFRRFAFWRKAKQIAARYGYSLSKRTQLYAVATRISNEANAFQTFGNSPITPTTLFRDPARGADPTGFGGGIIHTF